MTDQKQLRISCRKKRRSLSKAEQTRHAKQATFKFLRFAIAQRPKKIGVFLAQDGELDTAYLVEHLWQRGFQVYLPTLQSCRSRHQNIMLFAPYKKHGRMHKNHFGIPEPSVPHIHHISAKQLDTVLVPLTCFDQDRNRIGMGGGFYDRALAFKKQTPNLKPKMVGWAHSCQKVEHIPRQAWDVSLDCLLTEKGLV